MRGGSGSRLEELYCCPGRLTHSKALPSSSFLLDPTPSVGEENTHGLCRRACASLAGRNDSALALVRVSALYRSRLGR